MQIFKNNDFKRFMNAILKKYKSLGRMSGKIKLKNITKSEVKAFEEIGKYYKAGENIEYNLKELEIFFKESIYGQQDLYDVLKEYFGKKIQTKNEINKEEDEKIKMFFNKILNKVENTKVFNFYREVFFDKINPYKSIKMRYKKEEKILEKELIIIGEALNNLPIDNQKRIKIPIFSNNIAGNPHFFDKGSKNYSIFIAGLKYLYNIDELNNLEEENEILFNSGLLKDDISNYIIISGIKGYKENGEENEIYREVIKEKEYQIITLGSIYKIKKFIANSKKVFIVENPSVFSYLFENYILDYNEVPSLICSYGVPNLSMYLFLEKLKKENIEIYYSGDYDGNGLMIASKLKRRFSKIKYWKYDIKTYLDNLSQKKIEEKGISKIKNLKDSQLDELLKVVLQKRVAVYQESFIKELYGDISKK